VADSGLEDQMEVRSEEQMQRVVVTLKEIGQCQVRVANLLQQGG